MKLTLVFTFFLLFSSISSSSSNPPQPIKLNQEQAQDLGFKVKIEKESNASEIRIYYPSVINYNWYPYLGGWSVSDNNANELVTFSADLAQKNNGDMSIRLKQGLGKHGAWILYKCIETAKMKCKQKWPKGYMFENLEEWK